MSSSKLFLNSINIGSAKLGTSDVRMYLGEELVYPLGSVSITYDSATYNGTLQTAQNIVVTDESGNTLVENVDYVVTENNGGVNVGEYNLEIGLMGQYHGTASTKFVINKVTPTVIAPTAKELGYNSYAQELVNSGSTNYGTLKYSLDNSTWYIFIPTAINYGSYTVYYKVEGDNNVNEVAAQSITSVIKNKSSLSFSVTDITVGFEETNSNVVTVNAGDGIVTYVSNNPSIVTANNNGSITGVSVGNTTVSANISSTNLYCSGTTSYSVSCVPTVIAKFNVETTTHPTNILSGETLNFRKIVVDGVEQPSVTTGYTFSTTGEHTVKYYLKDANIGKDSFKYCMSMINAVIGSGTTVIGETAFYDCRELTSVTIPDSVTSISMHAFNHCSGLTSIDIPSSVTSIGNYAFLACSALTTCTIGSGVTTISKGIFYNCSGLTSVTIGSGVTSIDEDAFANCHQLKRLNSNTDGVFNIPNNVASIDNYAFADCYNLTNINIPSGLTSINNGVFRYCSGLTSVNLPNSVTSIGNNAFQFCSGLTSIDIPDSVVNIGVQAFYNCINLTSVTIGSGVTNMDRYAFAYCTGITSFTVYAETPPNLDYDIFVSVNNCSIYVPSDSVNAYKSAHIWEGYANRIYPIV